MFHFAHKFTVTWIHKQCATTQLASRHKILTLVSMIFQRTKPNKAIWHLSFAIFVHKFIHTRTHMHTYRTHSCEVRCLLIFFASLFISTQHRVNAERKRTHNNVQSQNKEKTFTALHGQLDCVYSIAS